MPRALIILKKPIFIFWLWMPNWPGTICTHMNVHIEPFIITSGENVFVCFLQVQSITYQLLEQGTKLLKEN